MGRKFTCSRCHRELVSERSEEEVLAEERELWGFNEKPEERDVLCDSCFEEFMEWHSRTSGSDA